MAKAKKHKRMGRHPKPPAERCSAQVLVHMTGAERKAVEVAAGKSGDTLSVTMMRPWRERKEEQP